MYFSRGAASNLHSMIYYAMTDEYAIEIRLTAPDKFSFAGATDAVERAFMCTECKMPPR